MNYTTRQSVIWALEELASREEQEKHWLSDGSSGEVSSFEEVICEVFDGGVTSDLASGRIPEPIKRLFLSLRDLVEELDVNSPPRDIIDDPRMEVVRDTSSELLMALCSNEQDS